MHSTSCALPADSPILLGLAIVQDKQAQLKVADEERTAKNRAKRQKKKVRG